MVHAKLLEIDCKSNSIRQQESLPLGLIFVDPFCSRTAAPLPRESHQDERAKTCCSARCSNVVACNWEDEKENDEEEIEL